MKLICKIAFIASFILAFITPIKIQASVVTQTAGIPVEEHHNRFAISRVLEFVARGEKNIADCSGKNLIIFIGGTQVGKSTTINALLGIKMEENYDGTLTPESTSKVFAPMGSSSSGGLSCTEFPALYISEKENLCFLDTQGFFELRHDPDMVSAASILMEMAVKKLQV